MKQIFSLIFLTLSLFGEIKFQETKYMAALDVDFKKYGSLSVSKDKLTIKYTKPNNQTINYLEDKIEIISDNNVKIYNFEKYPNTQYMGLILRAIVNDEYELVEQLFDIKHTGKKVMLIAKPVIDSYIVSIKVTKYDKDIIIINLRNKDKITIETIN